MLGLFRSSARARLAVGAPRRVRCVSNFLDPVLGLTEEQAEYYKVAADFAATEMAPFAAEVSCSYILCSKRKLPAAQEDLHSAFSLLQWDEKKVFPEATLRKAAGLGFGAMYAKQDGAAYLQRCFGAPLLHCLPPRSHALLPLGPLLFQLAARKLAGAKLYLSLKHWPVPAQARRPT